MSVKRKCVCALLLVLLCRFLSGIPAPFVNRDYLKGIMGSNGAFGIMNMLTGNDLGSMSVMALGITPYITVSIVIQLLAVVFPRLDELKKGMADERELMEKVTIAAGCVFSGIQGAAMCIGFGKRGLLVTDKFYAAAAVVLIWMIGTLVEVLIGTFISKKLIGNGISLILLANILSSYPSDAYSLFSLVFAGRKTVPALTISAAVLAGIFAMFAFTVFVEGCEKRIPVYYSQKIGGNNSPLTASFLPIRLCPGSVVPVIFASSLFAVPSMAAMLAGKGDMEWLRFFDSSWWFNSSYKAYYSLGAVAYVLMIFGFSYYYVNIELNPVQTSISLKKAGGLIPGIRQGRDTSNYLRKQMKYTILIGAAALSFIAMVPIVLGGVFSVPRVSFLGTSIIIACGVVLETRKTITAELKTESKRNRKYGGFFNVKKRKHY